MIQQPGTNPHQIFNHAGGDADDQAEQERRRVNRVNELFAFAEPNRRSQEPRWRENYEFYYGLNRDYQKKKEWQSKIFVPVPFWIIESKVPRLVVNMLTKKPIWRANPVAWDDEIMAKLASQLLSDTTRKMENIYYEATTAHKDTFIYGTAIQKLGYDYRAGHRPRNAGHSRVDVLSAQLIQAQTTNELVVEADNPIVKNTDIGEIYPDPTATCIEDCKFIIHRMLVPVMELKRRQAMGEFKNVDKIQRNRHTASFAEEFTSRQFSTHNFTDPFKSNSSVYDYVEILECWWVDPDSGQKWKTVVANRETVIQDVPMPFFHMRFPFYRFSDIPMTREFWGMGEIDPIKNLVRELNDLRNQRMDNMNAILKAFYLIDRTANIDTNKLTNLGPGGFLETSNMDGLRIERPPSINDLTFASEQKTMSDIQIASGVNDTVIGTPTRSQFRNATTFQGMAESSNIRFALSSLMILEEYKKIGRDMLSLMNQYMQTPQTVRITGYDIPMEVIVPAEDIPVNMDVYISLGAELQGDLELQKQQTMQLFSVLGNIPGFDITQMGMELLDLFGYQDPQRFFPQGRYLIPPEARAQTGKIQQALGVDNAQFAEMAGGGMGGMPPGATQPGDLLEMVNNGAMLNAG